MGGQMAACMRPCLRLGACNPRGLAREVPFKFAMSDEDHIATLLESLKVGDGTAALVPAFISLREYQRQLLADVNAHLKQGERAVLAYLPTGGGKTRVGAAAIASELNSSPHTRCLFVVNRRTLLEQTQSSLMELGYSRSVIATITGDDSAASTFAELRAARVHIAMVQSLHDHFRSTHDFQQYSLAVIDECHAASAPSYQALLSDLPDTGYVIGLTATPFRATPGQSLAAVFPKAARGPSVTELIRLEHLVEPVVYGPKRAIEPPRRPNRRRGRNLSADKKPDGAEELAQLRAYDQFIKEALENWEQRAANTRTIAFCHSVDMSKALTRAFQSHRIGAIHIDGSTSEDQRQRAIFAFRSGTVKVLCNVDVLSEGFDEPTVGCVMLLRHTQSARVYVQQVGRGLRSSDNKDHCIVLDQVGSTWVHGPLTGPVKSDYIWGATTSVMPTRQIMRQCSCGILRHKDVASCFVCDQSLSAAKRALAGSHTAAASQQGADADEKGNPHAQSDRSAMPRRRTYKIPKAKPQAPANLGHKLLLEDDHEFFECVSAFGPNGRARPKASASSAHNFSSSLALTEEDPPRLHTCTSRQYLSKDELCSYVHASKPSDKAKRHPLGTVRPNTKTAASGA